MITKELFNPASIVVVGGSNDITKPGGRILKNLLEGNYKGKLYVVNPKDAIVQGITCMPNAKSVPETELAIIAIACNYIPDIMEHLAKEKGTKAFIVLSAGFSEVGDEGKLLEKQIVDICNNYNASLIGPNCTGVLTINYKGCFAGPMPELYNDGCDFVSGSGATAVFIMETAILMGLRFNSVISVGNSAQIGVEDIIKEWDFTYEEKTSPRVKLIYLENIANPDLLLKHASSLVKKGCKIVAIKAGATEAGSRAASSHTGALASSDSAVDALFRKAGIIRTFSKQELVHIACIFMNKELLGKNIAVITHAGGPGVMLTDTLTKNGLNVPKIEGENAEELKSKLYHGSSVSNPIDFLATGTAEHLGVILDYVDNQFDNIDASVVIFGTPGLFDVKPVYQVLHEKMQNSKKPIFPVLPSMIQAKEAIDYFTSLEHCYFPDEVMLGEALGKVVKYNSSHSVERSEEESNKIKTNGFFTLFSMTEENKIEIRKIIDNSQNGYLEPFAIQKLLDYSGIERVNELVALNLNETLSFAKKIAYPIVMKAVGPLHKTDSGAVKLNIKNDEDAIKAYNELLQVDNIKAVMLQKMLKGQELFVGVKKEKKFGHLILFGFGGIFIEILKDFANVLAPVCYEEALLNIKSLKNYKLFGGYRGLPKINESKFAEIITRISELITIAPEIAEMDINPLICNVDSIVAVDARVRVEK